MNAFKTALIEICKVRKTTLQEIFKALPILEKIYNEDKPTSEAMLEFVEYLLKENSRLQDEIQRLKQPNNEEKKFESLEDLTREACKKEGIDFEQFKKRLIKK